MTRHALALLMSFTSNTRAVRVRLHLPLLAKLRRLRFHPLSHVAERGRHERASLLPGLILVRARPTPRWVPSGPSLYSDGSPLLHPIPQSMLTYMKYPRAADDPVEHRDVASLGGFARALVHLLVHQSVARLHVLDVGQGILRGEPGADQSPASDATAASRVGRVARRVPSAAPPSATRREEFDAELGASSRSPSRVAAARGGASARGRGGGSRGARRPGSRAR